MSMSAMRLALIHNGHVQIGRNDGGVFLHELVGHVQFGRIFDVLEELGEWLIFF